MGHNYKSAQVWDTGSNMKVWNIWYEGTCNMVRGIISCSVIYDN